MYYRIFYKNNMEEFLLDKTFKSKYNAFKYIKNHKLNDNKKHNYYVVTEKSIKFLSNGHYKYEVRKNV